MRHPSQTPAAALLCPLLFAAVLVRPVGPVLSAGIEEAE